MTDIISTVGSGGDYATLALWEASISTRGGANLVTRGDNEIAELIGDQGSGGVNMGSTATITADANNRCIIRPAAGEEYNPVTQMGARFEFTAAGTAIFINQAPFTELIGPVGVLNSRTGTATVSVVSLTNNAANALIDGWFIRMTASCTESSGSDNWGMLRCYGNSQRVQNMVIHRDTTLAVNVGVRHGINITAGTGNVVRNCSVYGQRQWGVRNVGVDTTIENVVAIGNVTGAFTDAGSSGTPVYNNNSSGDATALGASPLTSQTAVANWVDVTATTWDFHLAVSSPAEDSGINHGGFTLDFDRVTHNADASGWERGAFDSGVQPVPTASGSSTFGFSAVGAMSAQVGLLITQASADFVADTLAGLVDGAATAGHVVVMDGVVQVADITLQDPAFSPASAGIITLQGTPTDPSALNGGDPDDWIFQDGDDTEVFSTNDLTGPTVGIGQPVAIVSYEIRWPRT